MERSGDPTLQDELFRSLQEPADQPYPGNAAVYSPVPLDEMPADPDALLQTLRAGYREGRITADGSRPSAEREPYQITTLILLLLGEGSLAAEQRGALFGALAEMVTATSLGPVRDDRGREGRGVSITIQAADPLPRAQFEVVYDPTTSALLSWKATNEAPASGDAALTERTHIIIRSGQVSSSDLRP